MAKLNYLKSKGFTLIETVVILFVFCLIFSIPVVRMNDYQEKIRLINAKNQTKDMIEHYSRRAVLEEKAVQFRYYPGADQVIIKSDKSTEVVKVDSAVKIASLNGLRISSEGYLKPRTIILKVGEKQEEIKIQMMWGRMIDG